jgi:hypothetical protein
MVTIKDLIKNQERDLSRNERYLAMLGVGQVPPAYFGSLTRINVEMRKAIAILRAIGYPRMTNTRNTRVTPHTVWK